MGYLCLAHLLRGEPYLDLFTEHKYVFIQNLFCGAPFNFKTVK